jgi:predicted glycosyltransferase involved in capsule biosynthesis
MEWEETVKGICWESEKYKIKRTKRFRTSELVPKSIQNMGPYLYHCYEKNDKQDKYIAQGSSLDELKKRLKKMKK